jgi:hypothetical protein
VEAVNDNAALTTGLRGGQSLSAIGVKPLKEWLLIRKDSNQQSNVVSTAWQGPG